MAQFSIQSAREFPTLSSRSSAISPLPPLHDSITSPTATSVTPKSAHHLVVPIVAGCLGAAVCVLFVGLLLFWFLLRHRLRTATAQAPDAVPRSWVSDSQGGNDIPVVANHPSLSLDLIGAESDNECPVYAESTEGQLNKSTSVLDISGSVENALRAPLPSSPSPSPSPSSRRSPLPGPIEPYVPSRIPPRAPVLRIHTNVLAISNPGSRLSPLTPAQSFRSPVRPLPTTPCVSQPRSAKAEEAHRQYHRSRMPRSVVSEEDIRSTPQGRRRTRAHSITALSVEMDGFDIVQHHDGGAHARIDLPPPYQECLPAQPATFVPFSISP